MQICIRRGAKQIGGTAVEFIASTGERMIVDIGQPLDCDCPSPELLPDIMGLTQKSDDLCGILISHPHQDHFGLAKFISPEIPVFMGPETHQLMQVSYQHHLPDAFVCKNPVIFDGNKPFNIGPFQITPYLVDHSAYGAYAFLISADGKRVLYSGDFRAHGRKRALFYKFIKNPPQDVDVLLLEGSCLGRDKSDKYETEQQIEQKFVELFRTQTGVSIVQASAQNIDRIVSIFRACKQTGRQLVMTGYAGHVMMSLGNPNLPNFTWADVKKITTKKTGRHCITPQEIESNPSRYVVIMAGSIMHWLRDSKILNQHASFVFSMWDGYKEKCAARINLMQERGVKMVDIHTSGHADIASLQKFARAIKAKKIVPIHTFYPEQFVELFDGVEIHDDNSTFQVN